MIKCSFWLELCARQNLGFPENEFEVVVDGHFDFEQPDPFMGDDTKVLAGAVLTSAVTEQKVAIAVVQPERGQIHHHSKSL